MTRLPPGRIDGELLIDGYNLLHAAGLARRSYGPGEFEQARRQLLKLLAGQLSLRERDRTTVVFDAPASSLGPSPPTVMHGIRVIFAGGEGDADAQIERLIAANSAPRRLHVISSDHRIQKAARRRRAKYFDSEVFLDKILRRKSPAERTHQTEPTEKREGLTAPGEVEAWLEVFGDIEPMTSDPTPERPQTSAIPPEETPQNRVPHSGDEPTSDTADDELAFWQKRIAELWEQADDSRS